MLLKSYLAVFIYLVFVKGSFAQYDKQTNWYNNAKTGLKTDKAYKFIKKHNKSGQDVIVAVIDSGVDIEHEDLKGKIWVNSKEIPDNNIDDDKNGYIDDIHGWNFLGNPKGENQEYAQYEKVRIYNSLRDKFERLERKQVNQSDLIDYELYLKVKKEVNQQRDEYEGYKNQSEQLLAVIKYIPPFVQNTLKKENYSLKDLYQWKTKDENEEQVKNIAIALKSGQLSEELLHEQLQEVSNTLNYHLNLDYNDRSLIGDNSSDFKDVGYGNNNVEGPDALHGTHVAGIISAIRGNKLGGDGVADHVKIMSLRAVPNGDEHDKDISLAIRYAVDNGASVINMSFGKAYSIYPLEVYKALKYADSLGVLLIHAAGNDSKNIDVEANFPAVKYDFQTKDFELLLTIGASTEFKKEKLAADFSNYGKKSVDVFAPGQDILSTIPNNKYKKLDGTSMAAPMVAGAAALLKSYYPHLTMKQIKEVLLKSAQHYGETLQIKPGTEQKVNFSELSKTGSVVNLLEAVRMCELIK